LGYRSRDGRSHREIGQAGYDRRTTAGEDEQGKKIANMSPAAAKLTRQIALVAVLGLYAPIFMLARRLLLGPIE